MVGNIVVNMSFEMKLTTGIIIKLLNSLINPSRLTRTRFRHIGQKMEGNTNRNPSRGMRSTRSPSICT